MKKYYINPNIVINKTENFQTIFTPNVDKVFVLQDIESEVLQVFITPMCIKDAVSILSQRFTSETFNETECIQYINKLIEFEILVC